MIIDCSALSYAALHTTGFLSYNGKPTGIIYGFLRRILTLAEMFKTNDIIFCCDDRESLREKMYPDYKKKRNENRKKDKTQIELEARKSFLSQIEQIKTKILPAMGFKNVFQQRGFEADDLLAYWVNKLKEEKIVLITSDNDLYQCIRENCFIYSPQTKKRIKLKTFVEKYKVLPEQWALAKAIGGCSGDEICGIEGVSDPKQPTSKALKYINGEITKGIIYDRIRSKKGRKVINRNLKLVTLPFPEKKLKRMFKRNNQFNRKEALMIFDHHRFMSFLDRKTLKKWEKYFFQKG